MWYPLWCDLSLLFLRKCSQNWFQSDITVISLFFNFPRKCSPKWFQRDITCDSIVIIRCDITVISLFVHFSVGNIPKSGFKVISLWYHFFYFSPGNVPKSGFKVLSNVILLQYHMWYHCVIIFLHFCPEMFPTVVSKWYHCDITFFHFCPGNVPKNRFKVTSHVILL